MLASKILVAYDGSFLANQALEKAIKIASMNESTFIHVVHVFHIPIRSYEESFKIEDIRAEGLNSSIKTLERAKEILSELPPHRFETTSLEGYASQLLLNFAEKHDCDLIIMGSRGLSGIKELLLGSVSHAMVQRSHIPILIVK